MTQKPHNFRSKLTKKRITISLLIFAVLCTSAYATPKGVIISLDGATPRIDAVPSTFASFPDIELEAIYEELVREFVTYQTNVGLRAISRFPSVDLAMIYIEQPDGSEHQFLAIDPRQPTNPTDPNSIGQNQDPAKLARYRNYIASAYQVANQAVQRVINAVGIDANGAPNSNILVV